MLAAVRFPDFTNVTNLFEEFDRLFARFPAKMPAGVDSGAFPAFNVVEQQDKVLVNAELPGLKPEEIQISVHGNMLTLSGERKPGHNGDGKMSYHRRERGTGKFSKSFTFPFELNPEGVEARYVNGLLKIVLPKAESAKTRKIAVLNG
ncbi:MAG: Hsp20/alpha crystallin family protein [Deltaproteobacteria bacterium]|jgi:HSP20 family protein|nr:Hsp20/alpha crystallin family protein [Deltaproteobacteria bacterium]MDA8308788.1 Hsp20/alpha crystallin family protein [Deltaproteobacteria bacterium]